MAEFPFFESNRREYEARLRFLKAFVKTSPRLADEDELAFLPQSHELGLADARQQLAELALALDQTEEARRQLRAISTAPGIDRVAPLRALTAAIASGSETSGHIWLAAENEARSESLVELLCALNLAAGGRGRAGLTDEAQRTSLFSQAARRARVPQLWRLFEPPKEDGQWVLAQAILLAMHADYQARVLSQHAMRQMQSIPPPWALIDWTLLIVHLSLRRFARPFSSRLWLPLDAAPVMPLMLFLDQVAAELIQRAS